MGDSPLLATRDLISLVVPLHNEAAAVEALFREVTPILRSIPDASYEIICVNDGSTDSTLEKLLAACANDPCIRIVDLSRNFGKEAALISSAARQRYSTACATPSPRWRSQKILAIFG